MKAFVMLKVVTFLLLVSGAALAQTEEAKVAKIEWDRNVFTGFEQSMAEKKPLVVLFMAGGTEFSRKLDREVLDSEEMHAFASQAIFVWAEPSDEDNHRNYAKLKEQLGIERFPVAVVLATAPDKIVEVGRITGYFPKTEYVSALERLFQAWEEHEPAALIPVVEKAAALPAGWQTYVSRAGRFQIALPAKGESLIADAKLKQYMFVSQAVDRSLTVAVHAFDVPEGVIGAIPAEELLKHHAAMIATGLNGTPQDVEIISINGHTACRCRCVAVGSDDSIMQNVLIGRRVYVLIASAKDVRFDAPAAAAFFSSFKPLQGSGTSVMRVAEPG